jgi:sugar phosphate isomerase/epimerase
MKKSQIAAQLYTVRDFLKTPAEIAAAMTKIKKSGFDAVQLSGLGPVDDFELVKMLDGEGLICCATHESGASIVNETDTVIEHLKRLNCKYTAYPWPHIIPRNAAEAMSMAARLEAAAVKMAVAGQILTYHNHDIEFMKLDGKLMLDYFYDNAPHLQGELDTYWVQSGGANPTSWINKLKGRLPLLHLKDYGIIDRKVTMMHIGGGNLEWCNILSAAESAGTEWFIIEQDVCQIDPFESLKLSLDFLVENFVR